MTLFGLGAMGRRHARVLRSLHERFDLVGAYDVRADAEPFEGVARLASEAEAIALADVVVVATPIETHASVVLRALAAGKDVLVEKPLSATASEANAMVAAARGAGRLFVGHTERFNPVVRALARLLRGDEVRTIELRRVGPSRPTGCGALVNLGVHDTDLAAYLGGGEVFLRAALGAGTRRDGEDFAHLLFTTAAGASGHLYVDRTMPAKQRSVVVSTRRWMYEGDLLAHRLARTPQAGGGSTRADAARVDVPLALDEPLLMQAVALADALDGAPVREIATGADGARAVELAEQGAAGCLCTDADWKPGASRR